MALDPRKALRILAFPLFIGAVFAAIFLFREELFALFRDREAIRAWIRGRGAAGWLAFLGLQFLQVAIFVIPGEVVQVAGGYAFGLWGGAGLSSLGILAGSLFNFGIGRLLGRPFVESVFPKERVESLERIASSGRGAAGFFLLFAIPGIPKDALCYVAGMSRLGPWAFVAVSFVGRLPGILGSSFMGHATFAGDWIAAAAVLGLASILFALGLWRRAAIEAALARWLARGR